MPFKLRISKELSLNIRKCPHLLIIGKGNSWGDFAKQINRQLDLLYNHQPHTQVISVSPILDIDYCKREKDTMDERYELLSAFKFKNIEQFNSKFKNETLTYHVLFADFLGKKRKTDDLKQILMKGRAVGFHVIMFADSVKGIDKDLLNMFPVKLVYKVKNDEESMLLTGKKIAKKLKKDEFVLAELGKTPVIYENKI